MKSLKLLNSPKTTAKACSKSLALAFLGSLTALSLPSFGSALAAALEGQIQTPLPATIQNSQTDAAYLDQLYTFLRSQDTNTYEMATQSISEGDSIDAAQMFCRSFEAGVSPAAAFSAYTTSTIEQATSHGADVTEEMAYSVGLYGGAVMSLGTTYYCPSYKAQVREALTSLQ